MHKLALQKLNDIRIALGKTFKGMEADLHYSDSTLNNWFTGKSDIPTGALETIAEYFGTTASAILDDIPVSEVPPEQQKNKEIIDTIISEKKTLEAVYEQKFEMAEQHHAQMLKIKEDHYQEMLKHHREQYVINTDYLKKQVDRFRITSIILLGLLVVSLIFSVVLVMWMAPDANMEPVSDVEINLPQMFIIVLLALLIVVVIILLASNRKQKKVREERNAESII